MDKKSLENMFVHHASDVSKLEKYKSIRDKALEFGLLLLDLCPDSRELNTSFNFLDIVVTKANASMARYE